MNTPNNIVRLYEQDTLRDILTMMAAQRKMAFEYSMFTLRLDDLEKAVAIIKEAANIDLTPKMIERLLELYPIHKAYIIDDIESTDARGVLLEAVAQYFLGCDWPVSGDRVDFDKFIAALHVAVPVMRPLL